MSDSEPRRLYTGSGVPAIAAPAGSLYIDLSLGAIYSKDTGTGSTGWNKLPIEIDALAAVAATLSGPVTLSGTATVTGTFKVGTVTLTTHAGVPADATAGFGKGSLCFDTTNGGLYINAGDATSSLWQLVNGVGAADTAPASPSAIDDEFTGGTLDAKWAWVNQSDASASVANGALRLSSATGDRVWSLLLQSAPAAPWTIAAKLRMQGVLADFTSAGIAVRNSASGAHANIGLYFKSTDPGGGGIELQEYSDLTTYAADIGIARFGFIHANVYFKLVNDGTNLTSFYSLDGITYTQVAQTAIATVLGAVNQVGLSVWSINGGGSSFDLIVDWFRRLS
jgi:hypothetical protein